jgi:putative nucleotidyltransferase with HDIG domain
VDPFGGLADLAPDRPLRTVGAAADRFAEDPLRILRLFRIAAALGKTPDAEAREAASRLADLAAGVAAERLGTELTQLLRLSDPSTGLRGLAACGVLGRLVPGFQACVGFDQRTPHHALTVDEHLIQTCARTPPRPVLRWAGLLHDLAKPACFTPDPRGGHFYGHDAVGAEMAAHAMERLRLPGVWTAQVRALVANHLFPWEEAGPAAYRRLLRRLGGEAAALDLVALTAADRAAQRGAPWGGEGAARLAIRREARGPVPLTARQLAVSGRDVMAALGIGPGPAVGEALRTLLEAVTEDPALNRRDLLLGLLRPRRAPAAAQDADRSTRSP